MQSPSFQEFQESREFVADLSVSDCYPYGAQTGVLYLERVNWIEDFGPDGARTPDGRYLGRYGTQATSEEFYSDSLAKVERFLYLAVCDLAGWTPRGVAQ